MTNLSADGAHFLKTFELVVGATRFPLGFALVGLTIVKVIVPRVPDIRTIGPRSGAYELDQCHLQQPFLG